MISNEILKAALLGTDKYIPSPSPLLEETGTKILAQQTNNEDRFLKLAIATLLYEEVGGNPLTVENSFSECPPESLPVAGEKICGYISAALSAKDDVLFQYLIHVLNKNNEVLASELVPLILDKALEHKKSSQLLINVCGETGRWLCRLNENWRIFSEESEEEDTWETGHFESRKSFLKNIRRNEPAKAVALLEKTFATENAASRLAFLEQLDDHLSLADEPFLQSLLKDKSQKVKETAMRFLRRIQGSVVNKSYLSYLLGVISVREERRLLITKKKVLAIQEDVLPQEDLLKTGIDKVSSDKGVPDYIYMIGQMLQDIDPVILAQHLAVNEQDLIQLFIQHKESRYLLPFLVRSASTFKTRSWALALIRLPEMRNLSLLNALPEIERGAFYEQFIEGELPQLLSYLLDDNYTLLPLPLSDAMLTHLARNPYLVNQPVYQRLALHLPLQILPKLKMYSEDTGSDYQHRYFKSQTLEMMRLIDIKNNIN